MAKRTPLKKLAPHHRTAVALKLKRYTHKQIAAQLNTSKQVVDHWMQDKLVKAEIEAQAEQIIDNIHQQIASAAGTAVDVMVRRARAPAGSQGIDEAPIEEHHRIDLLERLLELHPATRSQPQLPINGDSNGGDTTNIAVLIGQMSPEEKKQFALESAKLLVEGTGTEKK